MTVQIPIHNRIMARNIHLPTSYIKNVLNEFKSIIYKFILHMYIYVTH